MRFKKVNWVVAAIAVLVFITMNTITLGPDRLAEAAPWFQAPLLYDASNYDEPKMYDRDGHQIVMTCKELDEAMGTAEMVAGAMMSIMFTKNCDTTHYTGCSVAEAHLGQTAVELGEFLERMFRFQCKEA